jgi:hypothetical protein
MQTLSSWEASSLLEIMENFCISSISDYKYLRKKSVKNEIREKFSMISLFTCSIGFYRSDIFWLIIEISSWNPIEWIFDVVCVVEF